MPKQAVIIITDGPNNTIDIKVDFNPRGADDKIISHQIAASAVQWITEQLKCPVTAIRKPS
jgi:hypothetical protein